MLQSSNLLTKMRTRWLIRPVQRLFENVKVAKATTNLKYSITTSNYQNKTNYVAFCISRSPQACWWRFPSYIPIYMLYFLYSLLSLNPHVYMFTSIFSIYNTFKIFWYFSTTYQKIQDSMFVISGFLSDYKNNIVLFKEPNRIKVKDCLILQQTNFIYHSLLIILMF